MPLELLRNDDLDLRVPSDGDCGNDADNLGVSIIVVEEREAERRVKRPQ